MKYICKCVCPCTNKRSVQKMAEKKEGKTENYDLEKLRKLKKDNSVLISDLQNGMTKLKSQLRHESYLKGGRHKEQMV